MGDDIRGRFRILYFLGSTVVTGHSSVFGGVVTSDPEVDSGQYSACLSYLAVTCLVSASPEEYKKFGFSGIWLHANVSLFIAPLGPTAEVFGGSWKFSNIFYVKVQSLRSPRFRRSLRCLPCPGEHQEIGILWGMTSRLCFRFAALCLVRRWIHAHASVHGGGG